MSSGFGFYGGKGRCFQHWQEFLDCYTSAQTDHPNKCTLQADDYYECLHHPKEIARTKAIRAQHLANKKSQGIADSKDYIVSDTIPQFLGLIVDESKK